MKKLVLAAYIALERAGEHVNLGHFHNVALSSGALPLLLHKQVVEEGLASMAAEQ